MIKKDYIQRYVDELSKMLAVFLQLKESNQPDEAEVQLNSFSDDYLGLNIQEFLNIKSTNLITTLLNQHQFTLTHFKLSEELLYHYYLLHKTDINAKSCTLEVLNYLMAIDNDYSVERSRRIRELTNLIK